jgi:uncharacterized membrane protein
VRLSVPTVGTIGVLIIAGHNLFDTLAADSAQTLGPGRCVEPVADLYVGFWAGPASLGPDGPHLMVLYSIVPWIGVMAAGYAFGQVVARIGRDAIARASRSDSERFALFLVLRGFNLYGDPHPWSHTLFSFLNTTKYPASLDFLLMTLGPTIALIPVLSSADGAVARALSVFGRVPFFYYALHIPLIHALALVVSLLREGHVDPWLFTNHPAGSPPAPDGYMWSLGLLYLVWAIAIGIL